MKHEAPRRLPFGVLRTPFPSTVQFPYGGGAPFANRVRYRGGWMIQITGGFAANAQFTIPHPLRKIPRAVEVLDSGASAKPATLRWSPWTASNVFVQFVTAVGAGDVLTLLIY